MTQDLSEVLLSLRALFPGRSREVIQRLEKELPQLTAGAGSLRTYLASNHIDAGTFRASVELKRMAGEVNVIVHAIGILLALPSILINGEEIESLSLGAGNTGKDFDLTTNLRVAEFKFIQWRGRDAIRQNQVFKDFLKLIWDDSGRRKQLYVTDSRFALKFLNGGRALESVLSKDVAIRGRFHAAHGQQFRTVGQYFRTVTGTVEIIDLISIDQVFREILTLPIEDTLAEL